MFGKPLTAFGGLCIHWGIPAAVMTFTVMYGKVNVNHSLVSRVTYLLLSALHSHVPFKEG